MKPSTKLLLFLILLFIRLPFFFRDYIDHDESTFILMGASVAEGYLPYDHLWDLKSPFLFYVFGLIEWIFPESFIAIRLFGTLIIYFSALLIFRVAIHAGLRNGLLIAVGYCILSSLFGSLQGVMSEHLAVFFILLGIYFHLRKDTFFYVFLTGMFMGLALLCKLNYAYAIVLFYLLSFYQRYHSKSLEAGIQWTATAGAGLILPFVLVSVPFLLQDRMQLFFDSTFLAPFAYGHSGGYTFLQKITKTWWVIVAGLLACYFAIRATDRRKRSFVLGISVLLLGTIFSFFTSGKVNGHYLIEVYPFFLLLILGVIIRKDYHPKPIFIAIAIALVSIESWIEYTRVGKHIMTESTPFNGKSFEVNKELEKRNWQDERIFYADYHIGYWYLDQFPLTRSTTHPSNLGRPYLFTYFGNQRKSTMEELTYILEDIRPGVIVSRRPYISFLQPDGPENKYFLEYASLNYTLEVSNENRGIYIWKLK